MPAPVVPAVATAMKGTQPCARSASMAAASAAASMRPCPSVRTCRTASRPMPDWWAILIQA